MNEHLVSVCTPSHHPAHLKDCWESLRAQTYQHFEWVVVPNGPKAEDITNLVKGLPDSERIRLVKPDWFSSSVSALKRTAFQAARGRLLVELDHDDELAPHCLAELTGHSSGRECFLYSDFAENHPDGLLRPYSNVHGWTYSSVEHKGKKVLGVRSWTASARSLCQIWYAPNHVRAWTRGAYEKAGGHDPRVLYADDHDLILRTYLAGIPFLQLTDTLYFQRTHTGQTSKLAEVSSEIQKASAANCVKNLARLIQEECRRKGKGLYYYGSHLDKWCNKAEVGGCVDDYAENSAGGILCFDYLQTLSGAAAYAFLEGCHRALQPGGWLIVDVPSLDDGQGRVGRGAFQDPENLSTWSVNSFLRYTDTDFAKKWPSPVRFQSLRTRVYWPSDSHKERLMPYVRAELCTVKPGFRIPGPIPE